MKTTPPVRVGMTVSASGWAATDSAMSEAAARFWVADTNARGGLDIGGGRRRPVELVTRDDASDPARVAELYDRLVREDAIDVALSPATTDLTAEAYTATEAHGVVLINTMAPDDRLFCRGHRYTFLASTPLSGIYGHLPGFFASMRRGRVAHVYCAALPGFQVLNEPLPSMLEGEPDVALVLQRTVDPGHGNWAPLWDDFDAAGADALVVSLPAPDEASMLDHLVDAGPNVDCAVFTYAPHIAAATGRFGSHDAGELEGIFGWQYETAQPDDAPVSVGYGTRELRERLQRFAPGTGTGATTTYVGLAIWAHCVAAAGTLDGDAVMRAVRTASGTVTTATGPFEINDNGCGPVRAAPVTQLQVGPQGAAARRVFPPGQAEAATLPPRWRE